MFILKLSECKQVELSSAVLAAFAIFKSFCSTWMVLFPFSYFSLSSLKLCCNDFSFSISVSFSSPIYITSLFFHSLTQLFNLFDIFCCTISLAAFSALSLSYLSCCIFKLADIFRDCYLFFHVLF